MQDEANVEVAFVEALLAIHIKESRMYCMILRLFQSKITRILATMTDLREEQRVVLLDEYAGHHQES